MTTGLDHPELVDLLRRAYSAERAAAIAYQGHAGSVSNEAEKQVIRTIEDDEWSHRETVLKIMQEHEISVSRWYEFKFRLIGRLISVSCYLIGLFMPFYFAGRLESGNVCEYFRMMHYFESLGINTIWLSPITQNPEGAYGLWKDPPTRFSGYHGYWILDFESTDAHLGTDAELQAFIDALGARGLAADVVPRGSGVSLLGLRSASSAG